MAEQMKDGGENLTEFEAAEVEEILGGVSQLSYKEVGSFVHEILVGQQARNTNQHSRVGELVTKYGCLSAKQKNAFWAEADLVMDEIELREHPKGGVVENKKSEPWGKEKDYKERAGCITIHKRGDRITTSTGDVLNIGEKYSIPETSDSIVLRQPSSAEKTLTIDRIDANENIIYSLPIDKDTFYRFGPTEGVRFVFAADILRRRL